MSVIEILIAFLISSLAVTGTLKIQTELYDFSEYNSAYLQAGFSAQQSLDANKETNRHDFNTTHNTITNDNKYQTTVTETFNSDFSKKVAITVSWNDSLKQRHTYRLNTTIANWQGALSGNACTLSGDWQNPTIIGSVSLGANNNATALALLNNYAYVTTDSPNASLPDLLVVDVNNVTLPKIAAQLNTGPGVSAIQVKDSYAYLGNTSINGQLQIITLNNPIVPRLVKSYKLPGAYTDNTTIPNVLLYDQQRIYVGTQKSQISELHVIDVKNPLTPYELGTFEIGAGINALAIRGNRLYVASPDNEELKIVNVADGSNITKIGGLNAPGGSGNGKSLSLLGPLTYLGRTLGGAELHIINDQNNISVVGTYDPNTSINSLAAAPGLLFAATTGTSGLQIWNSTNVGNITPVSSMRVNGTPRAIKCNKGLLFMVTENPSMLYIVSSQTNG